MRLGGTRSLSMRLERRKLYLEVGGEAVEGRRIWADKIGWKGMRK